MVQLKILSLQCIETEDFIPYDEPYMKFLYSGSPLPDSILPFGEMNNGDKVYTGVSVQCLKGMKIELWERDDGAHEASYIVPIAGMILHPLYIIYALPLAATNLFDSDDLLGSLTIGECEAGDFEYVFNLDGANYVAHFEIY